VKYHENLRVKAAIHKPRYDEVAAESGAFLPDNLEVLRAPPLQQIWLHHLLALSMVQADDGYDDGLFVFLYPIVNERCGSVSAHYEECLADHRSFQRLTLEEVVGAIQWTIQSPWIQRFSDRYLSVSKLDQRPMATPG
jgi:hypothetical protein